MSNIDSPALHQQALAALEAADMALAHASQLDIDGPWDPSHITAELLERELGGAVPDAKLEKLDVVDAHDGMTSRKRWRLAWNPAGQQAGLPDELFVKATPEGPYLRETLALLHMAENEVRFYNQIQPELPELAPKAWLARSYPGGRFMLLMEVLEARNLRPYWQADDCSLDHAKAVIKALASLHAQYWQSPRFDTDLAWVRPRTRRFGFQWHQQSFHIARAQYLQSEAGLDLPEAISDMLRRWDDNDQQVYAYWETLPATVLHGDSHLGNTFSYPDGRAGYFDWQVMYRGHGLRDVAYFFLGAVEEEMRRDHERAIVDLYLDELAARGVELDRDRAWLDYCLFALDRFDAHIKTYTRGGYGHAPKGVMRGRRTTIGSLLANDVPSLLDRVIRDGRL